MNETNIKILVACEESQALTSELRKLGVEAYSCDIVETSGQHPEWHIKDDVLPLLNGYCTFKTQDGKEHNIYNKWDCIFAFPPCTHLTVTGARHFEQKRKDGRQREGIEFFCKMLKADCEHILVENPRNIISGTYIIQYFPDLCDKYNIPIKPTQHIEPYEYGDPFRKYTCLWLKNLPKLKPTNIVEPNIVTYTCSDGRVTTFSADYGIKKKGISRSTSRSKTYPGIAKAMAEQYYKYLKEKCNDRQV